MQVLLKFAKTIESQHSNDSDYGGGIGTKTLGHGSDAEQHESAGMFKDGAQNLLALGSEFTEALVEIYGVAGRW